jgi:hypothetical protein
VNEEIDFDSKILEFFEYELFEKSKLRILTGGNYKTWTTVTCLFGEAFALLSWNLDIKLILLCFNLPRFVVLKSLWLLSYDPYALAAAPREEFPEGEHAPQPSRSDWFVGLSFAFSSPRRLLVNKKVSTPMELCCGNGSSIKGP